jgi:ribulose-5-phosphate 4-epimerase/fuculose-1-phosphate aldolase
MSLQQLRARLVSANHILAHEGLVDAFGHVSVRHPRHPDRFLISCSRSPELVSEADLMELGPEGNPIGGDTRAPYLERFIHAGIYAARPDVHAVVHHHAHELIPFGVTDTPLRPLIHVAGPMGARVPVWDIAQRFGDTSLLVTRMDQARDLAATLGDGAAVLMRGHGAVVVGGSLQHAVLIAIYMLVNARVDLQARTLGTINYLSDGEIARSFDALLGQSAAERAWEYFERRCRRAAGEGGSI